MANTRLKALAYVKQLDAPIWHIVTDDNDGRLITACELLVVADFDVRHRRPIIDDVCSVCDDEVKQSEIGAVARG